MSATKTLPFCDIPPSLLKAANRRAAARSAVSAALYHGLAPDLSTGAGETRETMQLSAGLAARVQEVADRFGVTFQRAWLGLMRAGIAHMLGTQAESAQAAQDSDDAPFSLRTGEVGRQQNTYWRNVISSLERGRIVVAEASTGLGKGRVIVAAALERARAGVAPVVVCAPTLKVLGQLWGEYERLRDENPGRWGGVRCAFLPGLAEFADPVKLREQIEGARLIGEPVDEAVEAWMAAGGKPLATDDSPLKRALLSADPAICYLAEDLRQIATTIDPASMLIDDGDDARVRAARDAARGAHVVFCTHAMVARQHQLKWSEWEQAPRCLIVDEAHEFERSVSGVFSSSFSIRAARRSAATAAEAGDISRSGAKALLSALRGLEDEARKLAQASEGERIRLDRSAPGSFAQAIARLKDALETKSGRELPRSSVMRMALASALQSLSGSTTSVAWLDFSPTRHFPSLTAGRADLGGALGSLWNSADAGVALCAASLLVPDASGNARADYIVDVLSLPRHRIDVPLPVVLRAVVSTPTMHTPGARAAVVLARPTRAVRDEAAEARWLKALSGTIENIVRRPSIRGGALVLLTSYAQVDAVRNKLYASIPERLVWQQPGERFADAQRRYEAIYRAGGKPVLLGLGAAWTGIDLIDHAAEAKDDHMLTDLIIGCLPVGLNRSPTMLARIERTGARPIEKEALMMLRQGLGRLIRREGLEGRHIWLLDGRLWTPWPGMEQYTGAARAMLAAYTKQAGLSTN